jgi:hypothetical protein
VWPDAEGRNSWLARFLDYLKLHGRLGDLAFMSFEHYPYDGCETPWKNIYQEPQLISHIIEVWRDDGLPSNVPLLDTETNAHGGEAAVDVFGALWLADSFAGFLSAGGQATFYYHALPYSPPHPACPNSWGTYHMFMVDKEFKIRQRTSQFFAAQLITQQWVEPRDREHQLFKAAADLKDKEGNILVTAYPVLRPDGQWSLLLINKDYDTAHSVQIRFEDVDRHGEAYFSGAATMISFGKAQYQWRAASKNGRADPDDPPVVTTINTTRNTMFTLPAASINVLRGKVLASH